MPYAMQVGTLASFESLAALAVLADLDEELGKREIQNVSGFLSGIMRRHTKQRASAAPSVSEKIAAPHDSGTPDSQPNADIEPASGSAGSAVKSLAERVEAYDDAEDSDEDMEQVRP
jgi:hypothetical protein